MTPQLATLIYFVGIAGLFFLARDRKVQTSKGLWVAIIWLMISGSRPVASWFDPPSVSTIDVSHNLEADPLNSGVAVVLLVSGLTVLSMRGRKVAHLLMANWPILLFFFYCVVSTAWSEYPGAAFRKSIRSLGDFIAIIIVLTDLFPVPAVKRFFTYVGYVLIPCSILLIKYYPDLGRMFANDYSLMFTGVTDHKNSLGATCLVLGLAFLWSLIEEYKAKGEPNRWRRLLALGTCLTMVVWLLQTADSATSSACFYIGVIVLVFGQLRFVRRAPGVVHILVIGVIFLCLFAVLLDPGSGMIQALGRNETLTGRTEIWRQVIDLSGNPIFGTGYESFWLGSRLQNMWFNNPGARLNEAHNGYLEVYLNLGWIGITLLGVLIVAGYHNVINVFRSDRSLGPLKTAYFVTAVIYSLTEAGFRMTNPIWIAFLLASTSIPKMVDRDIPILARPSDRQRLQMRESRRAV
jgi:exopolysaccharide production protein ExoQ